MKFTKMAALAALFTAGLQASPLSEMQLRFGQLATRAVANFRSADSIEDRLRAQGMLLHPDSVALRLRIEAALDRVEAAIGRGDLEMAGETLERATALVERYARLLGGA